MPQPQAGTHLPTSEGWKAELTWVSGYILRWFTRTQTVTHVTTIDYVPPNVGTFPWLEREQTWQMAHSLWQASRPGTSYRLIPGTLHQELCSYRISKLT